MPKQPPFSASTPTLTAASLREALHPSHKHVNALRGLSAILRAVFPLSETDCMNVAMVFDAGADVLESHLDKLEDLAADQTQG